MRRGVRPLARSSRSASITATQPAPSSDAPWPTSHESMCAPSRTISSGSSRPRSSPMALALGASGSCARAERELDLDRAALRQAREQVGVLDRHRRGGNLAHAVVVAERAGVRRAQAHRRHRSDQHRDGAALGGLRRGVEARLHALAVAGVVVRLVERRHAMVDEGDRPSSGAALARSASRSRTRRSARAGCRACRRCRRGRAAPAADRRAARCARAPSPRTQCGTATGSRRTSSRPSSRIARPPRRARSRAPSSR